MVVSHASASRESTLWSVNASGDDGAVGDVLQAEMAANSAHAAVVRAIPFMVTFLMMASW